MESRQIRRYKENKFVKNSGINRIAKIKSMYIDGLLSRSTVLRRQLAPYPDMVVRTTADLYEAVATFDGLNEKKKELEEVVNELVQLEKESEVYLCADAIAKLDHEFSRAELNVRILEQRLTRIQAEQKGKQTELDRINTERQERTEAHKRLMVRQREGRPPILLISEQERNLMAFEDDHVRFGARNYMMNPRYVTRRAKRLRHNKFRQEQSRTRVRGKASTAMGIERNTDPNMMLCGVCQEHVHNKFGDQVHPKESRRRPAHYMCYPCILSFLKTFMSNTDPDKFGDPNIIYHNIKREGQVPLIDFNEHPDISGCVLDESTTSYLPHRTFGLDNNIDRRVDILLPCPCLTHKTDQRNRCTGETDTKPCKKSMSVRLLLIALWRNSKKNEVLQFLQEWCSDISSTRADLKAHLRGLMNNQFTNLYFRYARKTEMQVGDIDCPKCAPSPNDICPTNYGDGIARKQCEEFHIVANAHPKAINYLYTCIHCNYTFCGKPGCFTEYNHDADLDHSNKTCGMIEKIRAGADESEIVVQGMRKCPNEACRAPIEKDAGCSAMICVACNYMFCWRCSTLFMTESENGKMVQDFDKKFAHFNSETGVLGCRGALHDPDMVFEGAVGQGDQFDEEKAEEVLEETKDDPGVDPVQGLLDRLHALVPRDAMPEGPVPDPVQEQLQELNNVRRQLFPEQQQHFENW